MSLLSVKPDKKQDVLRVSFESKDPAMAQTILNYYIVGMSEFLRRQTLEDASAQQALLSQQLSKTADPLLKNRLYELIAKQIEKETLAKVQKYYSFNVIDPPYLPGKKIQAQAGADLRSLHGGGVFYRDLSGIFYGIHTESQNE